MSKLDFDLLNSAPSFISTINKRQLNLRDLKIQRIENLSLTRDQNDTIDLTGNDLRILDNFPLMHRLTTLLLSNNRISKIDPLLHKWLPNLTVLILNNNHLTELSDLIPLADTRLITLSLLGNTVVHQEHYRSFLIYKIPSLRILDFQRITKHERDVAFQLFANEKGTELLDTISAIKTSVIGVDEPMKPKLSKQEIEKLKEAISKATTLEEITFLEKAISTGVVPNRIDDLLREARDDCYFYHEVLKKDINKQQATVKSFLEADTEWINVATGVDLSYRKLNVQNIDSRAENESPVLNTWNLLLDQKIMPRPGFKSNFLDLGQVFHQYNVAGRHMFIELFLCDIILGSGYNKILRVFPQMDISAIGTRGSETCKIQGKIDYAVGFSAGSDILAKMVPREVRLVVVKASSAFSEDDKRNCVAQAATLYKHRLDFGKRRRSVWGILSNARMWQFIFIDENGLLWQSETYALNLIDYESENVLAIYRIMHYMFKCCYEGCHPDNLS